MNQWNRRSVIIILFTVTSHLEHLETRRTERSEIYDVHQEKATSLTYEGYSISTPTRTYNRSTLHKKHLENASMCKCKKQSVRSSAEVTLTGGYYLQPWIAKPKCPRGQEGPLWRSHTQTWSLTTLNFWRRFSESTSDEATHNARTSQEPHTTDETDTR